MRSVFGAHDAGAEYAAYVQERQLTAQGIATRERIVRAATSAIAERGVAAMSLDQVLTVAGASKGQLYHYFTDRDDLVRAAVAATGANVLEVQAELMAELADWDAIERWFDCLVELQVTLDARGGCPLASLTGALADRDEPSRRLLIESFDAWEARLATGLASMRASGQLRADCDTARLATSTMAAVQGGLVLTQVRRDPAQLRIALDAALVHLRLHAAD
ncbi:MAG: TetR family transcriptional regulator [Thermoleophilia bacterium]|nr:TetR family transcriptional regulator [Thermoleophilia bacterium]